MQTEKKTKTKKNCQTLKLKEDIREKKNKKQKTKHECNIFGCGCSYLFPELSLDQAVAEAGLPLQLAATVLAQVEPLELLLKIHHLGETRKRGNIRHKQRVTFLMYRYIRGAGVVRHLILYL